MEDAQRKDGVCREGGGIVQDWHGYGNLISIRLVFFLFDFISVLTSPDADGIIGINRNRQEQTGTDRRET